MFSDSVKILPGNVLTVKLSLLGVNSLVVWVVSLTCVGDGGGLGAQAPAVTSVDLCPVELRALSSLQTKGSSEKWLAGSGSGKLTGKNRLEHIQTN